MVYATQSLFGAKAPVRTIVVYGADNQKWPKVKFLDVSGILCVGEQMSGLSENSFAILKAFSAKTCMHTAHDIAADLLLCILQTHFQVVAVFKVICVMLKLTRTSECIARWC